MCTPAFPWRKMKAFSNVSRQYNLKCLRVSSTNGQFHVKAWFPSLAKCKLKITIIHSSLPQYVISNLQIHTALQATFLSSFNLRMRQCMLEGVKFPLMETWIYNSRAEWMDGIKTARKKKREDWWTIQMNGVEWDGGEDLIIRYL